MSQARPIASSSSSNFQSFFNAALQAYEKKTKCKLLSHPLAAQLQSCDSPIAILSVLQDLIQQFDLRRSSDERLTNWLSPTVNVLYAFSDIIGRGVSLALSPANVVFSGIGILLLAAKDIDSSKDVLIDIFVRIESFFKRLESYIAVTPTAAMTDVIVKIMIEILSILGIATKEIRQGRSKKFVRKLLGRKDVEDALKRLDTLTMEEARMAITETRNVTHSVDDKVAGLIEDVKEANAEEKGLKLQNWLSPPDSSTNHNIARKAHHKGTTSWFFQGGIFEEWKRSSSLLWIHGKPGSGKSVLCSGIIEDIIAQHEAGSAIVTYFYCDFRDEDKQNCRNLILSIISQLCAQSDICCDTLSLIYLEHFNGRRKPSDETLTRCLRKIISLPDQVPIYIIVDALDECSNESGLPTPREEVLELVKNLVGLCAPNLHICVTSRPEIDIQSALGPLTTLHVSLHDQSGQKKDIVDYISSVVYSDTKMERWREEDRKLVIETLTERANGMFRWVYCQLEALRHCLPPSLRGILEELPDTLDETYERVLKEINKANREHARRLLQCLTVALRPLRVEELAEVLAIDFAAPAHGGVPQLNPNWRWRDRHQAFSHFSVKEFLTSDRLALSSRGISRYHIALEPAHTILAQACLGVLLRFEKVTSHIRDTMEYFLDADKPHWTAWSRVQKIDVSWGWFTPSGGSDDALPLYYTSLVGFYDLAEHLVGKHPEQINARGGQMVAPLAAALHGKHFRIAELLHQHGADFNVRGELNYTILHAACSTGIPDIVQWLLSHGADVNTQSSESYFPIHSAVGWGDLQVVRMLIEFNADIHVRANFGRGPLHLAASRRYKKDHLSIMQLLLDHGADPNARDNDGSTPLHHCSWWQKEGFLPTRGSSEGTRLLLQNGAIIDSRTTRAKPHYD
ncbi:hypothetical protein BGY98DRAFT_1100336 [Russula aff. rugulosa BPL654]|nr:hypothetical protein BGY98DRAFT_1100336 [Russula aff. rugulosa BPL654]